MNDEKVPSGKGPAFPFHPSHRSWWKPQLRTIIIAVVAIVSPCLLAMLVFGGRDDSGDAAGKGLAGALEAVVFAFGAGLIALVALVTWLIRYVRWPTIVMIVVGVIALAIIALIW